MGGKSPPSAPMRQFHLAAVATLVALLESVKSDNGSEVRNREIGQTVSVLSARTNRQRPNRTICTPICGKSLHRMPPIHST